jgi:hypothetical protein
MSMIDQIKRLSPTEMRITRYADAEEFARRTGINRTRWGASSSLSGFCDYLFIGYNRVDTKNANDYLADYLYRGNKGRNDNA